MIHSNLLKTTLFKDFYQIYPNKFQNKTNGVTPRRWIACANPELAQMYTEMLQSDNWILNLELVQSLRSKATEFELQETWFQIKLRNKKKLVQWIAKHCKIIVDENSLFDVMVKRIHEYKRQLMNALYVIHRYLTLKNSTLEERQKFLPRTILFGGKAAPGYIQAKRVIKLICGISATSMLTKKPMHILNAFYYQITMFQMLRLLFQPVI